MKYFTPKYTSVISSCIDDRCDPPTASGKVFTKWRTRVRLHLYLQSSINADLQNFFKEYFDYSGTSPYGHLTSKKTSPLQSPWLSPELYSTVQITPCNKVASPLRSLLPSPVGDLNSEVPLYTDLNDYDVEFESFTPEDIRGRPVDLINSCRDHPIASDSLIVIGLPGVLTIGIATLRSTSRQE